MKKFVAGIVSCLGVASSVLALADVFPQYNGVFLVLIGIFVGFLLGAFSPKDGAPAAPMSDRTKGYLLMTVMFLLPPLLLVGAIAAIAALGFMTNDLVGAILVWGFFGVVIAYLVAGGVAASIGSPGESGSEGNDKSEKNHAADQDPK